MLAIALCALVGVTLVQLRPALPQATTCAALLLAAALLFALRRTRTLRRTRALRPIALLFVPLFAGALWCTWRAQTVLDDRLDASLENRTLVIEGVVQSIPAQGAGRVQFDFAPEPAPAGPSLPRRIRLTWYDAAQVPGAGERWRFEARLREPRGFANPGGFDYERQLFREGVGATGFVRASAHNRRLAPAGWSRPVLRARARVAQRISDSLGDSPAAGVLAGLAVGATSAIPVAQWDVFATTGTTHLIAISGLHVTLLAGLAMAAGGLLWRAWPQPTRLARQDFASLLGAGAAIAYSALAGFSVPTQRTLVMLLVAYSVGWLRRPLRASHTLGLALLAVLIVDPQAALAPGFWLSFAAVAAILLAQGGGSDVPRLGEFLSTQGVVTVALAPATLVLFGSFSVAAPLANLFAIPLFSLVLVPMTLLAVALQSVFAPAGDALLRLTAAVFEAGWPVLEWLASWPGALVYLPAPSLAATIGLAAAAFVAMTPLPWRWRAIGVAMLLPVLYSPATAPAEGEAQVDVLDVGQGLAVVVRTHRHTLVYDTGPGFRSGRSAGDLAVLPFLRERRVRRVDLLVLSHADDDHAGGAEALVRGLQVLSGRYGGPVGGLGVPAAPCLAGEAWSWDGVAFEFLHPRAGDLWQDNDGSCVLRIEAAGRVLLLTGDIERRAERALAERALPGRADVVVVPHHGSRSSSTAELVGATGARLAIVSAGHGNRWRFPHAPVVERWCALGADVIETSHWGAIGLRLGAGQGALQPQAQRVLEQRYWRARTPYAGLSRCAGRAPVSSRAQLQQPRKPRSMWEIVQAGGPFMWPLIVCSIGAAAIVLERLWTLQRKRVLPTELTDQVWKWLSANQVNDKLIAALEQNSPLGKVLAVGLANRHRPREIVIERLQDTGRHVVHELERFLNTLGTIASIAPLLGLLGTVTGIINSFSAISTGGMGDPRVLSAGISEALIATAAGLCVAIPSLFAYRFLRGKVERIVVQMEKEAMKLVEAIEAGDEHVHEQDAREARAGEARARAAG